MKICPKCSSQHEKSGIFCCRECANSRIWTEEDKKKKSQAGRKYYQNNEHHMKDVSVDPLSKEHKTKISLSVIAHHDEVGRLSKEHQLARNRKNRSNYRARQLNAVVDTTDFDLIKKIFESCPKGYHVDHIIALAIGGKHHQDNLQYLPASENFRKSSNREYDQSLALRWQDILK